MNQTSFATLSEPKPTSDISPKVYAPGESVFSELSPNAGQSLAVLLNMKKNWLNQQRVLGMGFTLGRHGALENGMDSLLSAMNELKESGAIEDLTGSEHGGIRVKDGFKLEGGHAYSEEDNIFFLGCMMLYTAVVLVLGVKLEHLRAKCVEAVKEIADKVDPDGREVIRNTLSAGLCALARAHEVLGYEDESEELRTYSYKYDMTLEGRKRWEELMNEVGSFITVFWEARVKRHQLTYE
jgi:hypothetical protein